MKNLYEIILTSILLSSCTLASVFQTNGIKIGEVDQNSAIIWTRLTKNSQANIDGADFIMVKNKSTKIDEQLPEGKRLEDMEGAVPGVAGMVKISWASEEDNKWSTSDWLNVDPNKDFIRQYKITNLTPATKYNLKIESKGQDGKSGQTLTGKLKTAPAKHIEAAITFTVVTGQDYPRRDNDKGHNIYPLMEKINPDFFVHTGDIEYYDKPKPYATDLNAARFKWNRLFGLPRLAHFHTNIPSYFIKDDHDTTRNDSWPGKDYGDLTWEMGLDLFREQFPVLKDNYRTIRWGKDLQIWLVEGRDFRSANNEPDGPNKTIWGKKQKEWFFKTVKESDATFRILISPTPVVGPDRTNKNDNHSNKGFSHEGDEIRQFMASQKNMFVVCGDRHWQYVSVDKETGLKEFSCGPTSQKHASGWKNSMRYPEHKYLKVQGGFMSVTVTQDEGVAKLIVRHYDTKGNVSNEDTNLLK